MAEPSCRGDANTRRQSFRRSLADAALPQEYLDLLEQKRKQLDDSIHKYIAAKERDYKTYEKDLRVQYKQSGNGGGGVNEATAGKTRRTSSESTVRDPSNSPQIRGQQQQSVVDALLANGLSRQQIGQPLAISAVDDEDGSTLLQAKSAAGLVNRRASNEREKEFLGVFTPTFLPALGEKVERKEEKEDDVPLGAGRSESAPPAAAPSREGGGEEDALQRANSDSTVQAKLKRPVHLQLAHRTSSSGSSADGRLASALKSPSGERSKRKRVSLAVGDSIVKPSDNVPLSLLNNNHTPSHSRTRSSSLSRKEKEKEKMASIDAQVASGTNGVKGVTSAQPEARPSTDSSPQPPVTRQPAAADPPPARSPETTTPATTPNSSTPQTPISTPEPSRTKLDPDGDLFDLQDEDEDSDRPQSPDSTSDPDEPIVTGRVHPSPSLRSSSPDDTSDQDIVTSSPADHIESLSPSSYTSPSSSRQPTNPGFRRPSANMDPVYRGQDYERAEEKVVAEEIYGSRYERAGASSFTSGSLGESFMARNAELMRARVGASQSQRREAEGVRS